MFIHTCPSCRHSQQSVHDAPTRCPRCAADMVAVPLAAPVAESPVESAPMASFGLPDAGAPEGDNNFGFDDFSEDSANRSRLRFAVMPAVEWLKRMLFFSASMIGLHLALTLPQAFNNPIVVGGYLVLVLFLLGLPLAVVQAGANSLLRLRSRGLVIASAVLALLLSIALLAYAGIFALAAVNSLLIGHVFLLLLSSLLVLLSLGASICGVLGGIGVLITINRADVRAAFR